MKSRILFIVFLIAGFPLNHSLQAQWTLSNGLSGGNTYDIEVLDTMVFLAGHGVYAKSLHDSGWNRCLEHSSMLHFEASQTCLYAADGYHLLQTTDLGSTWDVVFEFDDYNSVCTIESTVFTSDYDSIFRSDDAGDTWTNITGDLPELSAIRVLSNGPVLYLDNLEEHQQLFRSFDLGNTWLPVTIEGLQSDGLYCMLQQGDTVWAGNDSGVCIFVEGETEWIEANNGLPDNASSPDDIIMFNGNIFCCGFYGIFKYSQGTWISINEGLENLYPMGLTKSDTSLFCATSGGPWQKNISGDWFPIYEGYNHINVNWTSIDDSVVWLCADQGLYKSVDFGENFTKRPPDSLIYCAKMLITPNAYFLACFKGFFVSYDKGETWIKRTSGLERDNVTDIAMVPFYTYISAGGLYRSRTGIYEWERVPNNIGQSNVGDVAGKDSIILANVWNDCLYRSNDLGENFEVTTGYVYELIKIDNRFYAINGDPCFSDDGLTWAYFPLDDPEYYGLTIDVQDNVIVTGGTRIYIGPYEYFLSISYDNGENWSDITDNLPNSTWPWVTHTNIHGSRIFAAPMDYSLYYRDDLITGIDPSPNHSPDLIKVYPNPFSEYFNVSFPIIGNEDITIALFDLLGNILVSQKTSDPTSTLIDLPSLSPGIYFIRVSFKGQSIVKKVVKL
jgi:hypothetical protein